MGEWRYSAGGGGTPLYGLNGDVRPGREFFGGSGGGGCGTPWGMVVRFFWLKRGINFITFCPKQGILTFKQETRTL